MHTGKLKIFIKQNPAFSAIALNLFLLVMALIVNDPFGILKKTYAKADPFFEFNKADITSINFVSEDGATQRLTKQHSLWTINGITASQNRVNELLDGLADSRKFTVVASGPGQYNEYGFDRQMTVSVSTGDKNSKTLYIGSVAPRGNHTHVRYGDSQDIYLVDNNLKALLGRGSEEFFINSTITEDFAADSISMIEIRGKYQFALTKENNSWKTADGSPVREEKIYPLLAGLGNIFAEQTYPSPEKAGISKSGKLFSVKFSFSSENSGTKTVTLTGLGQSGDSYFVQKSGDPAVYKTGKHKLDSLIDINPAEFFSE